MMARRRQERTSFCQASSCGSRTWAVEPPTFSREGGGSGGTTRVSSSRGAEPGANPWTGPRGSGVAGPGPLPAWAPGLGAGGAGVGAGVA